MENKTYYLKTFGCQMNEHDSLKVGGLLDSLGFQPALSLQEAGLILFNTCTVREKAHQKAFSEIGKAVVLKRGRFPLGNPKNGIQRGGVGDVPLIGVCGCVAQEEGSKLLSRFPEIDLVFGSDQIYKLPELLELVEQTKQPAIATELINSAEDYHFLDILPVTRLYGPTAFVTIMKGCNSQCSYCIVPAVRGKEVYRNARDIIREIECLVEKGCREVTLLGQNVNSYGERAEDGITFAKLIRLISDNTNVERIRFTSPHPKDCKEDLIEEYAQNPKLCPHIHLPLQSGSDAVLRRMRRAYNTKQFRSKVEALRQARPGISITTDIIVGFPGETDAEFQETLHFIQEIQFDGVYAFKYSPRPSTEAYTLQDDCPLELKDERLEQLLQLQRKISYAKNLPYEGSVQEILVEGGDKMGKMRLSGRTPCNKITNFSGQQNLVGAIVRVGITKAYPHSLDGEINHG